MKKLEILRTRTKGIYESSKEIILQKISAKILRINTNLSQILVITDRGSTFPN